MKSFGKWSVLLVVVLFVAAITLSGTNTALAAVFMLGIAAIVIYWIVCAFRWVAGKLTGRKRREEAEPVSAPIEEDTFESFGLYEPHYKFQDAEQYSNKLKEIRFKQQNMVKDKSACIYPQQFTYNGNLQKGAAVVNDWMKLMLRAFNGECEAIITKARYDNVLALEKRIQKAAETINVTGTRIGIQIKQPYVQLKIDELHVAYEYEQFKFEEKERLRQIREEEREKAKVQKELAEKLKKVDKDITHIQNEKSALQARLDAATDGDDLEQVQLELDKLIQREKELENEKEDIAQREVNARAGYVYIISNIGSFGENIYKIGMTRRLDPQDRVDELGDASVPFTFDVHAFIFSTDAVALETALHQRFDAKRVNLVNPRKEFFAVTLDEIEAEVKKNYNGAVEFHRTAEAQQYRETLTLRNQRAS